MRHRRWSRPAILAAVFCFAFTGTSLLAQFSSKPSFGTFMNDKTIELSRKLPPIYDLHGKKVQVVVTNAGAGATMNAQVQSNIEKLLTTADSTVQVQDSNADVTINCEVTRLVEPHPVTTGSGNTAQTSIEGGMNVAFRIVETRTRHVIAASVASAEVDHGVSTGTMSQILSFKKTPQYTTLDGENQIVGETARQIASYLVITPEAVQVKLAVGGELATPNKMAVNYLWARYLEALSELKPFDDPRLDAYRLYNIGVANEGLAYAAKDPTAAQKYLQEASINYGKAVEARPDEKNFLPAQTRIGAALEHFAADKELRAVAGKGPGPAIVEPKAENKANASGPMTNDDVINMVRAKVPEDGIIDAIEAAPQVSFDLTPNGLISLSTAGVVAPIQKAMRTKARGGAPTPAAAPAPTRSGGSTRR